MIDAATRMQELEDVEPQALQRRLDLATNAVCLARALVSLSSPVREREFVHWLCHKSMEILRVGRRGRVSPSLSRRARAGRGAPCGVR
jgi:hypothetical protein